jgi:hypothetical protein
MSAASPLRRFFAAAVAHDSRAWDRAALILLWLVLCWFTVEGALELRLGPLRLGSWDDYEQALALSRELLASGAYPQAFTYPLPGVLLRVALGGLGLDVSGLLWVGAMLAAAAGSLWVLREAAPVALRGLGGRRALLALLATVYFVQWDFRAVNSNVLFLGVLLGGLWALRRERPWLGGLLLAASVALKLYSVLLLPWLLWKGRWRAASACAVGSLLLFVLLPGLWLGPGEAWALTGSWLGAVADSGSADFPLRYHGYHTSLHSVLVAFLHGGDERVAPIAGLALGPVLALSRGLGLAWLLGVGWVLWRRRAVPWPSADSEGDLLEPALILALALATSSMAQPAHGVVLLLPAWLLLGWAMDGGRPRWQRGVGVAVPVVAALILELCPAGPWKALGVQVGLVLWGLGLAVGVQRSGQGSSTGV